MTNERALGFGAAAEAYERYRPEYPDTLVQLVREYAARPIRTALELGAGTGKATRAFARQGISVTASEPDPAMLAQLQKSVPGVRTISAALEELPVTGRFDLVFVAAALHWTRPDGRWDRICGFLAPGGVFANMGGAPYLAEPGLESAVRDAQLPWLIADDPAGPTDQSEDGMHWPATELVADERFSDVQETSFEQRVTLSRAEWIGYLSTVSAYLMLSQQDRAAAFAAIGAVLPDAVEVTADITLQLARRV